MPRLYYMGKEKEPNLLEIYFEWYLQELKEAGYVKSWHREPFDITISEPVNHNRYDFKTKDVKIEEFQLFRANKYTADYVIVWNPIAQELFYNILSDEKPIRIWCPFYAMIDTKGEHYTICDVKRPSGAGKYGNNASDYTFPIMQKIIYSRYKIFVTKVVPIPMVQKGQVKSGNNVALFTTTFVPKRYHLTDGGLQGRVINFKKQTLREYISYKTKEIDKINALMSVQQVLL